LVFLGLSVLELFPMYATDIRQTDVRQKHRLMHNKQLQCTAITISLHHRSKSFHFIFAITSANTTLRCSPDQCGKHSRTVQKIQQLKRVSFNGVNTRCDRRCNRLPRRLHVLNTRTNGCRNGCSNHRGNRRRNIVGKFHTNRTVNIFAIFTLT